MSDHDLLRQYARDGAQSAFAELVARHLNLVYSAARRQVRSPQLAEDVAQSVFVELARHAGDIKPNIPLVAWLHVVTRRTAIDLVRRESRRAAREEQAATLMKDDSLSANWSAVEPLLDEAVESLDATDRTAILLRYFQNKSLRDVGAALGTSDDAAQKRVSRALDQLREFFLRRGATVTAAGLATDLSAHALQTAPAGLGATISATVGGAGAVNVLAMTTLQKTGLAATLALVLGAGLYETTVFARQRADLAAFQRETADLTAALRHADQQANANTRQLDAARDQLAALQSATNANAAPDPAAEAEMRAWLERVDRLKRYARDSGKSIPEMALLGEKDWFDRAQYMDRNRNADPEQALDETLRSVRGMAAIRFSMQLAQACRAYVKAHDGQLPTDPRELLPYFQDNSYFKAADVTEEMLGRYTLRYTGALNDLPPALRGAVIVQTGSPDEEHDQRFISGPDGMHISTFADLREDTTAALQAYAKTHAGAAPVNASELLPFFNPLLSPFRQNKFFQEAPTLLRH